MYHEIKIVKLAKNEQNALKIKPKIKYLMKNN